MSIEKIKSNINSNLGREILIVHNEGRNKIYEYSGKLVEVYNNIFIILDKNNFYKRCFSYYDVLTENVKVFFEYEKK